MLAFFFIVLGVPLVMLATAFIFLKGISLKEAGVVVLAQVIIAGSAAGIVSCANTHDVEVWNGKVTSKAPIHVSCSHSYQCNCITSENCDSKGNCTSTTTCQTCYEHSYDVDWDVHDSTGEVFSIDRIDRQGLNEPPRFRAVQMGEPTSSTHSYDNYVKASPDSLFRHQGLEEKYAASLPENPQNVYDYYRLDRVVTVGLTLPDAAEWNAELADMNGDLGRRKQANAIVVIAKNVPDDWYYALEEKWVGGKKNDVVLVISVDEDMHVQWAKVMCWTTSELFKVKLIDDVMGDGTLMRGLVLGQLRSNIDANFVRKPMASFEYLKSRIVPSTLEWIITVIGSLLVAGGLIFVMQTNDVFGDEGASYVGNPYRTSSFKQSGAELNEFLPWYRRRHKRKNVSTHSGGPR
jgi:hypothetical protein